MKSNCYIHSKTLKNVSPYRNKVFSLLIIALLCLLQDSLVHCAWDSWTGLNYLNIHPTQRYLFSNRRILILTRIYIRLVPRIKTPILTFGTELLDVSLRDYHNTFNHFFLIWRCLILLLLLLVNLEKKKFSYSRFALFVILANIPVIKGFQEKKGSFFSLILWTRLTKCPFF